MVIPAWRDAMVQSPYADVREAVACMLSIAVWMLPRRSLSRFMWEDALYIARLGLSMPLYSDRVLTGLPAISLT